MRDGGNHASARQHGSRVGRGEVARRRDQATLGTAAAITLVAVTNRTIVVINGGGVNFTF